MPFELGVRCLTYVLRSSRLSSLSGSLGFLLATVVGGGLSQVTFGSGERHPAAAEISRRVAVLDWNGSVNSPTTPHYPKCVKRKLLLFQPKEHYLRSVPSTEYRVQSARPEHLNFCSVAASNRPFLGFNHPPFQWQIVLRMNGRDMGRYRERMLCH